MKNTLLLVFIFVINAYGLDEYRWPNHNILGQEISMIKVPLLIGKDGDYPASIDLTQNMGIVTSFSVIYIVNDGFNYTNFIAELNRKYKKVSDEQYQGDGVHVIADIQEESGSGKVLHHIYLRFNRRIEIKE